MSCTSTQQASKLQPELQAPLSTNHLHPINPPPPPHHHDVVACHVGDLLVAHNAQVGTEEDDEGGPLMDVEPVLKRLCEVLSPVEDGEALDEVHGLLCDVHPWQHVEDGCTQLPLPRHLTLIATKLPVLLQLCVETGTERACVGGGGGVVKLVSA